MDFKHIVGSIKEIIVEDDDANDPSKPDSIPVKILTPIYRTPDVINVPAQPQYITKMPPDEPPSSSMLSILADLRAKTDFDSNPVGQKVAQGLAIFDGIQMSEADKIKAMLRATARDGLTADSIIQTVQGLKSILPADQQQFDAEISAAKTQKVDAPRKKANEMDGQITDLKNQLESLQHLCQQLLADATADEQRINALHAAYTSASSTRAAELDQMISHYQSLLQGQR